MLILHQLILIALLQVAIKYCLVNIFTDRYHRRLVIDYLCYVAEVILCIICPPASIKMLIYKH